MKIIALKDGEKLMTRRKFIKTIFGTLLTFISLVSGTYAYAYYIEPRLIHNNRQLISSKKIPKSFDKFKIVQFSDTHLGFHFSLEQLETLIKKINSEHPDVIVFTGDLIDKPQNYQSEKKLIHSLNKLRATSGKYWVYGNHDHGGYGTKMIHEIMDQANFTLLKNNYTTIEKDDERIILAGIDDVMLGKPNLKQTFKNIQPDDYTILLAHEPDIASEVSEYPVDLQLSGHSHGGQVRLPFIGHLYTPPYAEKYIQGKYKLNDGKMNLFVSAGIGTTRLPLRLFCQPEYYTFTFMH